MARTSRVNAAARDGGDIVVPRHGEHGQRRLGALRAQPAVAVGLDVAEAHGLPLRRVVERAHERGRQQRPPLPGGVTGDERAAAGAGSRGDRVADRQPSDRRRLGRVRHVAGTRSARPGPASARVAPERGLSPPPPTPRATAATAASTTTTPPASSARRRRRGAAGDGDATVVGAGPRIESRRRRGGRHGVRRRRSAPAVGLRHRRRSGRARPRGHRRRRPGISAWPSWSTKDAA